MAAEPQSSSSNATAGVAPGHNRKSSTSPSKAMQPDASVEMKAMKPERDGGAKGSIPLGEDIMQIARIGEVPAMQRIFEEKKMSARYTDEEGITPLHVRIYNQSCVLVFSWAWRGK